MCVGGGGGKVIFHGFVYTPVLSRPSVILTRCVSSHRLEMMVKKQVL